MRISRFSFNGEVHFGIVKDQLLDILDASPLAGGRPTGKTVEVAKVQLLPPVAPGKIICIGMNYAAHAAEIAQDVPDEPLLFFKPISALIGPEDTIILPTQSDQVELEAELAIVIGKRAKNISATQAMDHILGFTVANDVTARDLQFTDLQWARAKGFDTFCPLGPWIETELDPSRLEVVSRVNSEVRQHSNSSDMIFDVPTIVSYVSQNLTLEPGDVILTGSPAGISKISRGNVVECEIEGIGILRNRVA